MFGSDRRRQREREAREHEQEREQEREAERQERETLRQEERAVRQAERACEQKEREFEQEMERIERERERVERERERLEQERERLEELRERLEERQSELEELEKEIEDLEEELDSAGDVKEVLDVVSERIPNLMRGIQETIYSPEQIKKAAEGIALFYKTLVDAGMDQEVASTMTINYVDNLQTQLRMPRHAVRIPHIPDRPEIPDLERPSDAASFQFRATGVDESESTHEENHPT